MKKGALHVDWVFSMGLFIVYLIILFLLIKPGIKPIHKAENLAYIVENNFKDTNDFSEGAYWVVKRTPLLIYNCTTIGLKQDEYPSVKVSLSSFWEFSDGSNEFKKEYKILPSCMGGSNVCDNISLIYYPTKFPLEKYTLNLELFNCYADFGATESVIGISENRFLDLIKNNLKINWSYPLGKDFRIYKLNRDDMNYNLQDIQPDYSTGQQDEGASVFVKRWRDFILDEYGILKTVIIHLEVW
ncbi:MAG: hypothetical protein V1815_00065 [Candidatus Woesearchaeota archaeon]